MVLDDREAYELSCSIEPSPSGVSSARSSEKFRRKLAATNMGGNGSGSYGHRKNDSIASTSSSSSSQFLSELDNVANLSISGDTSSFDNKAFPVIQSSFHSIEFTRCHWLNIFLFTYFYIFFVWIIRLICCCFFLIFCLDFILIWYQQYWSFSVHYFSYQQWQNRVVLIFLEISRYFSESHLTVLFCAKSI